jgi:hypothetical protein
MSTTAREQIKQIQAGQYGTSNDFNGSAGNFAITPSEVAKLHRRVITATLDDANTANQDCDEKVIFNATNGPVRVKSAGFTTPLVVAKDAADYITVTLAKRTAGGAATTIATLVTTVAAPGVALAALTPAAMALVAAAVDLALNDSLTIKVVKSGAGQKIAGAKDATAVVDVLLEEI